MPLVIVVGAIPGVVAEHGPAPLGALAVGLGSGGKIGTAAACDSQQRFGGQESPLALAHGGRVRGQRDRPEVPGVTEIAANHRQKRRFRLDLIHRPPELREDGIDQLRMPAWLDRCTLMIASAKPRASAPLLGEMSPCVPLAKIDGSG